MPAPAAPPAPVAHAPAAGGPVAVPVQQVFIKLFFFAHEMRVLQVDARDTKAVVSSTLAKSVRNMNDECLFAVDQAGVADSALPWFAVIVTDASTRIEALIARDSDCFLMKQNTTVDRLPATVADAKTKVDVIAGFNAILSEWHDGTRLALSVALSRFDGPLPDRIDVCALRLALCGE